MNIEALAYELAYEACFDAEMRGLDFTTDDTADIEHFLPASRHHAVRYANILSGAK